MPMICTASSSEPFSLLLLLGGPGEEAVHLAFANRTIRRHVTGASAIRTAVFAFPGSALGMALAIALPDGFAGLFLGASLLGKVGGLLSGLQGLGLGLIEHIADDIHPRPGRTPTYTATATAAWARHRNSLSDPVRSPILANYRRKVLWNSVSCKFSPPLTRA